MPASSFVHLHVHTHYSLLDGATRIEALVETAKRFDMPAVAITDHGNLFGAVEFYTAARKAGVKPIIGCETYMAPGDRRVRDRSESRGAWGDAYHLLLLATNLEGYQNLMRLASIGYTEGFYRRPRIDKEVLREYSGGLICTSSCISGEIPRAYLAKDRAAAEEVAKTYLSIFGPDRFFIELQDHDIPEQRLLNPELVEIAGRLGVATIATNDVHYLEHDDVEAHDVLCCINTGKLLADEDRFKFSSDQFYFKSAGQMSSLFSDYPEAVENTLHVAEMCNLELDLSQRHAPVFRVPADIADESGEPLDDAAYLRQLVYGGAKQRYPEITPELRERIDYELNVITGKGFASYFLIVWDCVDYALKHGIPVGARGSACSSVVAYCLRLSSPDPIRYELYFERFMDPDRDEMPDIDLDICQNGRARLLDYVREKYEHVAQIITFGTLKARAVIKDVARVVGLGFEEANNLTKLIPFELKMTLDKALEQEPELKQRYSGDATVRRIIDIGRRLEGVARNAGVHAAGVVVADQPLVNLLPLYKAPDSDAVVTQFDGPTVERVGLLKMDFLGLRTLTILERARQLAERSTGDKIDLERLDLTDAKVYELFARGDTKGVFQFESGGMRDVLMRLKPNRIEDLIAANALYRPGPMEYIPEYISRKHGASWTTPHRIMTEVLQETYGIMVYQEQVSRLVNRLGGIELKAAFRLAKAISKKKTEMIEAMREPFLDGCVRNGVKRDTAEQVFKDILKFGGYAFNKAHSTGYSLVAYRTAWMKTYHSVEFMAALMSLEMGNTDKVAEYAEDCKTMGITLSVPDINASEYDFVVQRSHQHASAHTDDRDGVTCSSPGEQTVPVDGDEAHPNETIAGRTIRYGLGAIKGVGAKAVAAIVEERERRGPYKDLFDFCERVDLSAVNRGCIEALICAGAFDGTGAMRRALADALDAAISMGQTAQRDRRAGQMSLFSADNGLSTDRPSEPRLSTAEWSEAEMLAREKSVLGFYITKHPLTSHVRLLESCATATTVDLARRKDGDTVVLGGMVSSLRTVTARGGRGAGRKLGIATIEDLKGRVEVILFPDVLSEYGSVVVPDAIVFLEGAVDRKREEPSLRVSRVVVADEGPQMLAAALLVDLRPETPLDQLVQLFQAHPGDCQIYLSVETADRMVAQIECNSSLRVACTPDLLHQLTELLGRESICLLGPTRRPIPLPSAITSSGPVPASAGT